MEFLHLTFALREQQLLILRNLVRRKTVMGILPVGFGKSLTYQLFPLVESWILCIEGLRMTKVHCIVTPFIRMSLIYSSPVLLVSGVTFKVHICFTGSGFNTSLLTFRLGCSLCVDFHISATGLTIGSASEADDGCWFKHFEIVTFLVRQGKPVLESSDVAVLSQYYMYAVTGT